MIYVTLVALLVGFLSGSIMYGTIIAKLGYQKNIKKYGSKNPGSTNMGRILGKSAAILTFIMDGLKGLVPVIIFLILKLYVSDFAQVNIFVAGYGAVLGHCFSPLEKFQGGKGVATSMWVICFISPLFLPMLLVSWIGSLLLTGYVSVASVMYALTTATLAASVAPIIRSNYIYEAFNLTWTNLDYQIALCMIIGICLLIVIRHHANLSRLINGIENKSSIHKFLKKILQKK